MYVHTDREEYIAGEDLWFKLYLIDRQTLMPSDESKIAYIEILNPENRPVIQKRIRLNGGSGTGHTILPDTLSSGRYIIRAYTNWMKNFMPFNCFSKTLVINNALGNRRFVAFSDSRAQAANPGTVKNLSVPRLPGLKITTEKSRPGTTPVLISVQSMAIPATFLSRLMASLITKLLFSCWGMLSVLKFRIASLFQG
jgi:hypothetical protein